MLSETKHMNRFFATLRMTIRNPPADIIISAGEFQYFKPQILNPKI